MRQKNQKKPVCEDRLWVWHSLKNGISVLFAGYPCGYDIHTLFKFRRRWPIVPVGHRLPLRHNETFFAQSGRSL